MKKPKKHKKAKVLASKRFLEVYFGTGRDAHPEIYDFFLERIGPVLTKMKQSSTQLVLERLEPLNTVYSHLKVSNRIMTHIFKRYCKAHGLKAFAAFSPKEHFSCKGTIQTRKLDGILEDYNVLFDLFFCDVRIKTKKLFVDAMDLFSNHLLVEADLKTLKQFQKLVKKALPKTRFRLV